MNSAVHVVRRRSLKSPLVFCDYNREKGDERMAQILLVEDSVEIKDIVVTVLKQEHSITWAPNLKVAQEFLAKPNAEIDLVLLDIDLPDGNGIDFLSEVGQKFEEYGIGTIFLTGTNTVTSRVRSFALGAADYIVKPFDIMELQVRVNAKLKGRKTERKAVQSVIRGGRIQVDLTRQQAFELGDDPPKQIDLTPVEFRLLLLFLQNAGEVVPRQKILDTVWGQTAHVSARCVDHHVCGLRKKISSTGGRIESVYGVGYRIET